MDVNDENDNRELVDDIKHQTLQQEDIERMRKEGVSGHAILQELASSSVTFDGKTDFSKKKYLKKKSEKYICASTRWPTCSPWRTSTPARR